MKSYSVKQKKVTDCVPGSEKFKKTSNNRTLMLCVCNECGIMKTKFVSSIKGGNVLKAIDIAEKVTKSLIPSTKPVFDRYWSGDIAKCAFNTKTGLFSKQFWSPICCN